MKPTFLNSEKPILCAMVLCSTPDACIEKIKASISDGAEAIGIQLEKLKREYRTPEQLKRIFDACGNLPIYATSYRGNESKGLSDEELVDFLLMALDAGATLIDVMGDVYCPSKYEITYDEEAVAKQKKLVDEIHARGGEVLMSCHTHAKLSCEETLKIARAQKERGVDVVKIVNVTEDISELPECFETILTLKNEIGGQFLYLCSGPCHKMVRQVGCNVGVCMYLAVQNYGPFDPSLQPRLADIKLIRDHMMF